MTGGWPVLLALAGAVALWSPRRALTASRVRTLRPPSPPGLPPGESASTLRRWLLAGAAGAAAGLLMGGAVGLVAGPVVAALGERWLRRSEATRPPQDRTALARELPVACDLLAVCLSAGVPVVAAVAAVGAAVPAPIGPHLRSAAALCRLGAEPRRVWAEVPAELAPLGRVLVRSGESGAVASPAVRALATDSRATARAATEAAVRRAGVWVLAPLGLCFLPAFVCLGVVPMVLGIAGDVFG